MMDFQKGLEIHKKLFPRATPHSQLVQLDEELKELSNAFTTENVKEEIGDVINVAVSLLRFKETENIGNYVLKNIYFNQRIKEQKRRMMYYKKALEKCKKRISDKRYSFVNGVYKRDKNFYKND